MSKKVISFALWGDNPDYLQGAVENIKILHEGELYIGWEPRIYYNVDIDTNYIKELQGLGAKMVPMVAANTSDNMFWRFIPMLDKDVSLFVSRDCDSRLNDKEYQAVLEWEKSDKILHSMKDHANHQWPPVLGGMFGVKLVETIDWKNIYANLLLYRRGKYGDDQMALMTLYSITNTRFLIHGDLNNSYGMPVKKFPPHKPFKYGSFIGERITADNKPGKL